MNTVDRIILFILLGSIWMFCLINNINIMKNCANTEKILIELESR